MGVYFSVIIPTLNEEKLLPRLLSNLSLQTIKDFEVIVIDADSTDSTPRIARSFAKNFAYFKLIKTYERNISHSRNLGAAKSRGKYLVFIDADNNMPLNFLRKIKEHTKKGFEVVIPAIQPDSSKVIYKMGHVLVNFLVFLAIKFGMPFSTGGNIIIKSQVFKKIGGFDESIFVGEDHDMVGNAFKKGVKVTFVGDPKITFSVRRFEKEGHAVVLKYFISTLYIVFFGKITKKIYKYEMGGHYYSRRKGHS